MAQTIDEVHERCLLIVGREYNLPITGNKGLPGIFLEDLLGIPHTSRCLDCADGELKIFPVKKLKSGKLVPEQTMAITMLSPDELRTNDFNASKCCKKMSRMLVVPYYRNGDTIMYMTPKIIDRQNIEFAELYATIESDYNEIRNNYIENGILQSETGTLLQNRTKGQGGSGPRTRAFYLRKEFMQQYVPLSL
jgi:hypothetical protein